MGKHAPSPPPPPDPNQLVQTQGTINRDTLLTNANLNRPNQTSPFGNVNWTQDPNNPERWTQSQSYDPRIVQAYFDDLANTDKLSNMAGFMGNAVMGSIQNPNGGYRSFREATPDDPNGFHIPAAMDHIDPQSGQIAHSIDTSGLMQLPGADALDKDRLRVENALYSRQTSRLDPQWDQRGQALESQLANEGFSRGSEAWSKAMDDFERQKADAYAGARNDTIAAGGDEQSRLFADALSGRGQQFGERQSNAAFGNQAAEQDFGQRFQSGQFQNAIRSQRFGEELTQRNQPFAEFMQLVHGNSPNMPNMSNTAQIQGMQAPDYMSAVGMNQAGAQNAYNQQMGARNNMFSTVGRVASSFAGK